MIFQISRLNIEKRTRFIRLGVGILVLLLGFFIFQNNIEAKEGEGIIINEIMYNNESGESDWVEIFNNSSEDINLKNWKLIDEYDLERSKKGDKYLNCHTIIKEEFIIKSGEFTVISKSDRYDIQLKSLSLKNSGEDAVRISDDGCESFVDEVEYDPKKDEEVDRGYSLEVDDKRWRQSYIEGGTPGKINSEKPKLKEYNKDIRINEIYPNPKESPENKYEFIELYNFSEEEIDLDGWKLIDKSDNSFDLRGILKSKKYLSFYNTVSLNNSGDDIFLKNPNGDIVSEVNYKKSNEGKSYNYKNKEKWEWSTFITPEKENEFVKKKIYSKNIRINEILPNPEGAESNNEFIELYNYSDKDIDLENWIIGDSSKNGKYVFEKNIIKSNDFFKVYRKDFKFALNNSGEEVVNLINPNNEVVFEVRYNKAREGTSYGFDEIDNKWRWSNILTPGNKNKFIQVPNIQINIDDKIYKNVYADFEVRVKNTNKNDIKVKWNFGDGRKSYKQKTSHKYKNKGNYIVIVNIFNGSEEFEFKRIIEVDGFPRRDIEIVALMPNPKGEDSEVEWVEIRNNSKKKIDIKGWSIATGKNKKSLVNHPINKKTPIKSGKTKKITKKYSNITLNNKGGYIEIRYPDGKVADKLKYENINGFNDNDIYRLNENKEWIVYADQINMDMEVVSNKIIDGEQEIIDEEGDINEDVLGVQSWVDINRSKIFFGEYNIKKEVIDFIWRENKSVRIENDIYYFNPPMKKQRHYLISFLGGIF